MDSRKISQSPDFKPVTSLARPQPRDCGVKAAVQDGDAADFRSTASPLIVLRVLRPRNYGVAEGDADGEGDSSAVAAFFFLGEGEADVSAVVDFFLVDVAVVPAVVDFFL